MSKEVYKYTEEEHRKLGDAVVWTCILAAVHQDGIIQPEEKAVAVKQTHIRTYSTEEYIQPIYEHLENHFERDFEAFSAMLPLEKSEQEPFIAVKMKECLSVLEDIGPLFAQKFSDDLRGLYNRVFQAHSSVFQLFVMPVVTAHLEKFGLK